jgi:NADH:ubiquinone oxidoreductase subunit 5 (subunit L)/multisubunit Na+/H+ antiporter MnhA subunit
VNALAGFSLVALLVGIVVQLVLGRILSTRTKGWLAFSFGILSLAGIIVLAPTILKGQTIELNLFPWQAESPFGLYFDGLSLLFALMGTGIGSAILFYCIDYMEHETSTTRFYALMLTFIAGLVGLVSAHNLLMVYLCWEIIGLCSYFLVGFWYKQKAAVDGAKKVLVMTHIPGYALLIGILLLYKGSGTLVWTDPALAAQFGTGIFILFLIAAMAKSVMFPIHTWIPEAMNAPTPVSALLHSACYVKAGVYLVARMYSITPWHPSWNVILIAVGCATMVVGALYALVQTDLKRLLAFSTISQLGYIMTAFGLGTPLGLLAGAFYVFSHGLFKGTLFLCAGSVQHATGTKDMRKLGGLASRMPGTTIIWLVAAAAIIGVPLTNGFVAKWLLYDAALQSGAWVVVIIAWLVSTFTAFYILKATVGVFFGEPSPEVKNAEIKDASPRMLAGMGVLALASLFFGVVPQLLIKWVAGPAVTAMKVTLPTTVTFLGLQTNSGGAPVTAGAILTLSALLIVGVIFAIRRPSPKGVSSFTGGDPLPEGDTLNVIDFSEFAEDTFAPAIRVTNPDPVYFAIWHAISWLANRVKAVAEAMEERLIILLIGAILIVAAFVIWL